MTKICSHKKKTYSNHAGWLAGWLAAVPVSTLSIYHFNNVYVCMCVPNINNNIVVHINK